jgi:hypothetical protein
MGDGLERNILSLVGGNGGSVDTVANTSNASSDNKLGGGTTGWRDTGNLDNDTNDHNSGTEEDTLAASELVTKDEDEDGAKQATDGIDGDDETFVGGIAIDFGEGRDEGRGGDDTTHNTLIITEEEEIGNGNDGDEDLEHPTGLAPVGGNTIFRLFDTWRHGCSVSVKAGEM